MTATIVWVGPVRGTSGYAEEGRSLTRALSESGFSVTILAIDEPSQFSDIPTAVSLHHHSIADWVAQSPPNSETVYIYSRYWAAAPVNTPGRHIWRTMFECQSVPPSWLAVSTMYDEIWVPSAFNVETFLRGGVERSRLRCLPCPVPEWNEMLLQTLMSREASHDSSVFNFLSVMKWEERKGWDVLMRAFTEEFGDSHKVRLTIKTSPSAFSDTRRPSDDINQYLRSVGRESLGNVRVIAQHISNEQLLRLYAQADAFVLPSRGEGWGRGYMEAMLCGLPAIGTAWSGNLSFMTPDNSILLGYDLVDCSPAAVRRWPYFTGQRWAEPSKADLREAMRNVVSGFRAPTATRRTAMAMTRNYSLPAIGRRMQQLLAAPA